ncbi:MAG: type II secretion system major pseudopilin GspG [Acidobacteriota bacterium]
MKDWNNELPNAGEPESRNGLPRGRAKNAAGGFTLIELLVVMVIIGLLAALVGPRLFKNVGKSKITAAKTQIANFQTALGAYKLEVGVFPSTEEGLQALRVKPLSANRWDGPYLAKEVPLDPWGNPYVYRFPGEHGDEPDIISYGADGREGGEGENEDVVSWK